MPDTVIELQKIEPTVDSLAAAEVIQSQIHVGASTANYFSCYRYVNTWQLLTLCISACCAIAAGSAMPLVTLVFGDLAGAFLTGDAQTPDEIRARVQYLTIQLVYIAIGSFVTTTISTWGLNVAGEQISRYLQERYLSSLMRQNMAYFDVVGTGELTSRIDNDRKLIQVGISQKTGAILSGVSGFLVATICAFTRNTHFASVMITQPISLILLVGTMGFWLSRTQQQGMAAYVKADNLAQEVLGAMRTVIAYGSQERYARKYYESLQRPAALEYRERFIFGVIVAGSFTILHWANGLGFWVANRLFQQGRCTIPQALMILYAASVAGGMLCQALPFVVAVTKANGAAGRVFSVIERVSPIDPLTDTGRVLGPVRGEIRFEGVSFAYPSRLEHTILNSISFDIGAGETVVLIGASGAGKSTVFALLERLYHPLGGRIILDGEPIDGMNVSWLRSQIGYVTQDVTLFRTSILDNIAYGLPKSVIEKETAFTLRNRVVEAAKVAHLHSFIANLPQGYETIIGPNGSGLSGGQRQRLAIARAIVSRPPILLFDEATASLDSQSEKEIQDALKIAAAGRTTLIISHRLSTVQHADKIIMIRDGRVIDQGSPVELMHASPTYRDFVRQQSLRPNRRSTRSPADVRSFKDTSTFMATGDRQNRHAENTRASNPQLANSIKQVWSLNRPESPYISGGIFFSILAGMTYPIQAIFFGNGIISIINPDLSTGSHGSHFWVMIYVIFGAVVFMVYCVRGYCFAMSATRLHLRARSRLFKALLLKKLPFMEEKGHSIGALTSFLSSGTQKIIGVSGTSVGLAVESIVMLGTGITVGCIFGWKLGLAASATVPFIAVSGFFQYYIDARVQRYVERDTDAAAIAHEALSSIKTVTVLGLQHTVLERFECENHQKGHTRYWLGSAIMYGCTTSLRILSIAFVFWYGGTYLIATGEYNIQQFFICFAATVWGSQSAAALFAHAPDIAGAHGAAAQLSNLRKPDDDPPERAWYEPGQKSISVPRTVDDLALRHIKFSYPSRLSQLVLDDVSLDVPAGCFIAFVGASGCGKSSVLNLLERFYVAHSGEITLRKKSVRVYDLGSYRRYLVLVDQNPCLVGEDLRECLQGDDRVISDEAIITALRHVGLGDFALSLAQGLNTPILTNGSTLSGGQRQRIAIAKALLCEPHILLLDEATSALDGASEELVQRGIQQAMKGRTIVAVAHRLKTVVNANMIYVFDQGRIIERGTHDELMNLRGEYWHMAQLQKLN